MASLTYDLTLAGLTVGSAAALTGMGLVVTYRATGVLNLAHGAIAMVCAYVLRQLVVEWHWPLAPAAALTLLVAAPGLGVLLDVLVFRPLSVQGNDPARTLVASIGVFVLLVGGAALIWGPGARADAPALVTGEPWGQLAVVAALAALVGAVTRWTRFGGEVRAVVDNRELAALGGIDTDRVASVGWAFGAFTAGLTGVLLAPYVRLDPYGLPLLVVEVIAVAVIARMRSVVVAVGAALLIGVAQAQLTRLHPAGRAEPLVQAVGANLFVVALLVAALVLPGVGTRDALSRTTVAAVRIPPAAWLVAGVLFLLPLGFAGSDLHTSVQVPALAIVLLSLVVVSGRGGQISLGQTAYAGLGALFTGRLSQSVPELVALLLAVLLVAPLGLLTGRPAIRRHGLALALATLAVSVAASRFVFAQPYATSGLTLTRPAGLGDDRAYYTVELALLACALLAVAALRRGRTGRALAAMRDHEEGAQAAGVPVPALKVVAFVVGAALAALGGGLLSMGLRTFDPGAYDPVRGLLWFAAVVVLGADNLLGAPAAAALLVGLDAGTRGGVAAAAIGLLALLVGRFPQAHELLSRWRRPPKTPPATARKVYALPAGPAPAAAPELAAHGVRLSYGSYTVLAGVDLAVPPGRVTALIGGNGAGKTTLFHCLCGTLRPDTGRVAFGGADITRRPAHARTRLGIARTFQRIAVFPSLTVEENVRIGAEQGRVRDPAAVEQALRLMGLAGGVRRLPAAGLPTGTLRRVELGRALAGRPHTLLLDEPAAGLDTAEAEELARVLRALAADGMAVLVVEHDLDLVADIADKVHVMRAGRIG
ncbi:ATP-binding cassette domain-containing protein [Streptomyces sp. BPTC-684]|uniref:ABC transporter permease subunit n=1 Tax=Streptomyces sp. BPTC-684 TaxID=3043734 RepID=UPI0024B25D9C|nr:ATP-binding cassette domain-containing protein [Streptomyces sp. BPTC-684]WHM41436.1 ATP-binding cassette domain-containing protein [Streptomyces sp. BPTC-684]